MEGDGRQVKLLKAFVLTAIGYLVFGLLGQTLAIPPGYATVIWPASGIALGACLIWGPVVLPAVFLGSFFTNLYISYGSDISVVLSSTIALGASFQAYVGYRLVKRTSGFPFVYHDLFKVIQFLFVAAPLSSLINASISCYALFGFGVITYEEIATNWLSWWFGDTIGVVVTIPWLLVLLPTATAGRMPKRKLLLGSLIFISIVTCVVASITAYLEHRKQATEFNNNADLLAHSLQGRVNSVVDLLYGLGGFIATQPQPLKSSEFEKYANQIINREQGITGLSWNPIVKGTELKNFESYLQQQYPKQVFKVKEKTGDGKLQPVTPRDKHVVVSFIAPYLENASALGYDVYSQAERRQALDLAHQRGKETVTDPIRLVQTDEIGLLMFLPVFADGGQLMGFATAVLNANALAKSAFASGLLPRTGLMLLDPNASNFSLLLSVGDVVPAQNGHLDFGQYFGTMHRRNTISIGEREWQLLQSSSVPFIYQPWGMYLLLASGLMVAGTLSWFLIIVAGHTSEVEHQVKDRTRDLTRSNELLDAAQKVAHLGSWQLDLDNRKSIWSDQFYALMGFRTSFTASVEQFLLGVDPRDRIAVQRIFDEWAGLTGFNRSVECRLLDKKVIKLHCKVLGDSHVLSIVAHDITESHDQRVQLQLAAVTFESQNPTLITDSGFVIQRINTAFTQLTGFSDVELIKQSLNILVPEDVRDSFEHQLKEVFDEQKGLTEELWISRVGKRRFLAECSISAVMTMESNEVDYFVVSVKDITERKQSQQRIHNLAYYDPLTQLPNRAHLLQHLQQVISHGKRTSSSFSVMFLDLDGFKNVNDSMGHDVGDQLLCMIADRIRSRLGDDEFAARLGGDEFCVIAQQADTQGAAAVVAQNLLVEINHTIDLQGVEYLPRSSIGIALFPDDGDSEQQLLKAADTAMYRAKANGKNQHAFYHRELTQQAVEQFQFETDLRNAVYSGQLELYFQPQYSLHTGQLIGAEALIRWPHPSKGLLYPDLFLPIADRLKLTEDIDLWVLDVAARQVGEWNKVSEQPMSVSVNISTTTFLSAEFVKNVKTILSTTGLDAQSIEIEISDAVSVRSDQGKETARLLRKVGVSLALDNFGSVGSSMIDLTETSFDTIKIDRSFISRLTESNDAAPVLGTMVGSGHSLNAVIVALGVETLEHVQILHGLGCDIAQGYYFSRPVAAHDIRVKDPFSLPDKSIG